MKKIRFGLIGSGWRAEFYLRIARLLPEEFEITAVMTRNKEKAAQFERQYQVSIVEHLDDLLQTEPDYTVLAIKRGIMGGLLLDLIKKNVPVLCETPPGESLEELIKTWEEAKKYKAKVQIAEQYFLQPLYAAWEQTIQKGMLGQVQNLSISALHEYHGASIIRRYLNVGFENAVMHGKRYYYDVTETFGRDGVVEGNETFRCPRERLTLEFENGCVAYYDFSDPAQYHSFIRTRQLNVQGTRGEIDDLTIRYLTDKNIPVTQTLHRVDLGVYNNQEWSHQGLMLGETYLYRSPFPSGRLNDDEIAVATCMKKMGEFVDGHEAFYGLADALQDMYISLVMKEALERAHQPVSMSTQCWADKEKS